VIWDELTRNSFVVGKATRPDHETNLHDRHIGRPREAFDQRDRDVDASAVGSRCGQQKTIEDRLCAHRLLCINEEKHRELLPMFFWRSQQRDVSFLAEDVRAELNLGDRAAFANVRAGWTRIHANHFKLLPRAGVDPEATQRQAQTRGIANARLGQRRWDPSVRSIDLDVELGRCSLSRALRAESRLKPH
jgi:hypothetical protein